MSMASSLVSGMLFQFIRRKFIEVLSLSVSSKSSLNRSPVVMPSSLLNSDLHGKAAQITKRRFHEEAME